MTGGPEPGAAFTHTVRDGVATVTLDRPDRLNALSRRTRRELTALLAGWESDEAVRVYLITGTGRAFCVGHDVKEAPARDAADAEVPDFFALFDRLAKPSVAALNGVCVAGGASLALGCDVRFASPGATIGWTQARLGLVPVSGPCLLPRMMPGSVAMRHLLTGEPMSAATAARWGLVEEIVAGPELLAAARECALAIARCAPLAVAGIRRAAREALGTPLGENLAHAAELARVAERSDDAREGVAAFREKRDPRWRGR